MATSSWRGALEFNGMSVNIALYNKIKSRSSDSFKMLGTDEKPVKSVLVESDQFAKLEADPTTRVETIGRSDTRKGVPVGKSQFKALPPEAVDQITGASKSGVVEASSFVPLASIPVELGDKAFAVLPDDKVVGAERDVNVVWNGLRESGLAYTTNITVRAGSRDAVLAVYADDEGLHAVTLPFKAELNDVPHFDFVENAEQAEVCAAFISAHYEVGEEFDHAAYESEYRKTRDAAIEAALAGVKIEAPKEAPTKKAGPSLMDTLQNAVDTAKPKAKKAPAKKAKKAKKATVAV